MSGRRFLRGREPRPSVGEECEAFLAGRYADLPAIRSEGTPAWIHLNRVAHGTGDDLQRLRPHSPWSEDAPPADRWSTTVAWIANEVLRRAADEDQLRWIQTTVLWPLEDELIDAPCPMFGTPVALHRLVASALSEFDQQHRTR